MFEPQEPYLVPVTKKHLPPKIGSKAANLGRLMQKGYLVPKTYALSWDAYLDLNQGNEAVLQAISAEIRQKLDLEASYAVRSSADVEDSSDYSFAGQFTSVLNVQGVDRILQAVTTVWKASQTDSIRTYQKRSKHESGDVRMAVIIQRMIDPVISGVAFSINPISTLDEIVVEAVSGSGEMLVQEGVTPRRWVSKWGNWVERPESDEMPLQVIQQIVDETQSIAKKMKSHVDLEWVFDGRDIYWVQMRDITALEKAEIYSNKIAKEMTPGLIKPLDWSVVVPIKSKMWINVISQVIGDNDLDPNCLAKLFNYRAYHNLTVFGRIFESFGLPRESLDVMMGVAPPGAGKPPFRPRPRLFLLMPRIVRFLWDKWTYATKAQRDYSILRAKARQYSLDPPEDIDESHLLEVIDQLKDLNLQTTTHTFHAILLMQIYSAILRSLLQRKGVDFADFDLGTDLPELETYNPNRRLAELHQQFLELDKESQAIIASGDYSRFEEMEGIEIFKAEFQRFIDEFGHMSDRTVLFDSVPWRETPGLILELISSFELPKERILDRKEFAEVKGRGVLGWIMKVFFERSQQFYLLREQYGSLYTYTLMLFRVYYRALGARMAAQGLVSSKDDIYYLYDQEIQTYVDDKRGRKPFQSAVRDRKDKIERCKNAVIPEIIYGDAPPPVVVQNDHKLTGTPTSRGYYTGTVKLVKGINDFHKVDNGDVIVIPYSEVGWVPLFAKAGAVIAESGGMLSHSSIVAREYGIPAVVSVNGALYLQDNQIISIDGYKGEVFIHNGGEVAGEFWE